MIKYLIGHGAYIHAENDYAIRESASRGHLRIVELLMESGANIHADTDFAVRWSARNGHFDVIKYLTSIRHHRKNTNSKTGVPSNYFGQYRH